MRARQPDVEGHVQCDGLKIGYEVFGNGAPTLLLVPGWTIIHSRCWKLQVPYLADHFRVITFDRPGNGRSDRPLEPAAYTVTAVADQALAVMDATGTDRAVLVSLSRGVLESLKLAADHPDRVLGAIFISPALMLEPDHRERTAAIDRFFDPYPADPQRWDRLNAQYWLDHYADFAASEVLLADVQAITGPEAALEWAERVSVPNLVIHGGDDPIGPLSWARSLARCMSGELAILEGAGHIPLARDPVRVNDLI